VSVAVSTEPELGAPHSVFFNRGAVASQEVSRRFEGKAPDELDARQKDAAYLDLLPLEFERFKKWEG
jgi:hypothetical protein